LTRLHAAEATRFVSVAYGLWQGLPTLLFDNHQAHVVHHIACRLVRHAHMAFAGKAALCTHLHAAPQTCALQQIRGVHA
jgi:hypothetical protein